MDKPCLFCEILAERKPAAMVFRTDPVAAFLDVRPLFKGHVLVLPTAHRDTLLEVPPEELGPLWRSVQQTAAAVQQALDAHGTFIAINNRVSQSVPHLHIHVVPRRFKDGLRGFFWPRQKYAEGEMETLAARIAAALPACGT